MCIPLLKHFLKVKTNILRCIKGYKIASQGPPPTTRMTPESDRLPTADVRKCASCQFSIVPRHRRTEELVVTDALTRQCIHISKPARNVFGLVQACALGQAKKVGKYRK